jgi:hypothetical protein
MLRIARQEPIAAVAGAGAVTMLGTLVGIDADGRPLVTVGNGSSPVVARVGVPGAPPSAEELQRGVPVVLLSGDGADAVPVIIGVIRERFEPPAAPAALVSNPPDTLELNGRTVIVEGRDEIVLRCGLGSLTIRANGQIVVKGTRLISRASETNKIRGASVQIN